MCSSQLSVDITFDLLRLQLLDDCWASTERDSNGNIQPDPTRFPSGMPALAEYVHSRGLSLGLYTCSGAQTCKNNRTGSGGHEAADAATFASWEVDYIKEDNCFHPDQSPWIYYGNMSAALNATGRPMWFATCNWGEDSPWLWAPSIAQSYRAGPDHLPLWDFPGQLDGQGVINIVNHFADINNYSQPYGWPDSDFLMTGLVLSDTESETEFAMWAMFGGPMIIATDIRNMSSWKASVVLNGDILAINNDTFAPGRRVYNDTQMTQVWVKPLSTGEQAVVLLNANDLIDQPVTVTWAQLGWSNSANVTVYDVWAHQTVGAFTQGYSTSVRVSDCA